MIYMMYTWGAKSGISYKTKEKNMKGLICNYVSHKNKGLICNYVSLKTSYQYNYHMVKI